MPSESITIKLDEKEYNVQLRYLTTYDPVLHRGMDSAYGLAYLQKARTAEQLIARGAIRSDVGEYFRLYKNHYETCLPKACIEAINALRDLDPSTRIFCPPSDTRYYQPFLDEIKRTYGSWQDCSTEYTRTIGTTSLNKYEALVEGIERVIPYRDQPAVSVLIIDDIISTGKSVKALVHHLDKDHVIDDATSITLFCPLKVTPGSGAEPFFGSSLLH